MGHNHSHGGHSHGHGHGGPATGVEATAEYAKVATKVEVIGVVTNLLLFAFKYIAGIVGNSGAMISDATHTASDVFADIIAIFGIKLSDKKANKKFVYGYEKVETIFNVILGAVLLYSAWHIGHEAVDKIIRWMGGATLERPTLLPIIAAVVSIVTKELLFRYVIGWSKKLNSTTLKATAWHHRSDSFSSIGALFGIVGAFFGIAILDAVASLIICLIILKIGVEVFWEAVQALCDVSAGEEYEEEAAEVCGEFGVKLMGIKTRKFGHLVFVDVRVGADADMTVKEATILMHKLSAEMKEHMAFVKSANVQVVANNYKGEF